MLWWAAGLLLAQGPEIQLIEARDLSPTELERIRKGLANAAAAVAGEPGRQRSAGVIEVLAFRGVVSTRLVLTLSTDRGRRIEGDVDWPVPTGEQLRSLIRDLIPPKRPPSSDRLLPVAAISNPPSARHSWWPAVLAGAGLALGGAAVAVSFDSHSRHSEFVPTEVVSSDEANAASRSAIIASSLAGAGAFALLSGIVIAILESE